MEMRVKDTKSFRTQYRRFDNLTKNQFDTQFQYLSIKYQYDPAALYELDVLCEEAFMDAELFEKEYLSILEKVGEVFFINNMNKRSLDLFKKLIGFKPFMKRVLRDFFRTQSGEKKAIHDLYKFIIQNQFRVNKTQYKFYLSFISSIFFFNHDPENLKAIDLKKIFIDEAEVEIPFQRILDRIHENLTYLEKDEPNFGLVEKEQARSPFAHNLFADLDLKNQVKDSNDKDDVNPSEEKILDDDFLREVNTKDDDIDGEMKLPEDEEEEEKKENKNEQKKENKNEIFQLDSQSDEEVKRKDDEEPNFDNSLTVDLENIKDASSFLDEKKNVANNAQANENNEIKENPNKIENLKEPPKTIETNTLNEIKKKLGEEQDNINESNVASKSEIAMQDYMIDFIIPKGKMISRSVKNIEIVRGKFTLHCDHCNMPKLENIIKKSKIRGIRECITCCNLCGKITDETDDKEKNTDELESVDFKKNSMVEDKKEIPPKEAQTLEQLTSNVGKKSLSNLPKYELKAFFRMSNTKLYI